MTLAATALPFGLRDVRLTPLNDDGSSGTPVDLPASRTFSFSEAEDFEELRGDDGIVAIRGKGANVSWSLEGGGISFAAWKVLSGGSITLTGTTPNQIRKFSKVRTDTKPYFKAEGQAISDSGGDFHAICYKCRASGSLEGSMGDGVWLLTSAAGEGIPDINGAIYDLIQNETVTAIP